MIFGSADSKDPIGRLSSREIIFEVFQRMSQTDGWTVRQIDDLPWQYCFLRIVSCGKKDSAFKTFWSSAIFF